MDIYVFFLPLVPLITGFLLDKIFGDPAVLPHPVVGFGKCISFFEHQLNKGTGRMAKGGIIAVILICGVYIAAYSGLRFLEHWPVIWCIISSILVFYCLAGTTLIREVREVFLASDRSLEEGRRQVARIVGRDTAALSKQEVRIAALETLAENLSDGVIAPLFWFALLGVPGMLTYKMINTLDSMIGYRNERYKAFGCIAARIDDAANFIPARITAFLMILCAGRPGLASFIISQGRNHASPNSGYPEAALAGILNCRFGGPHDYFGETVYKPFIGNNEREVTTSDMRKAVKINIMSETVMVILTASAVLLIEYLKIQV